MQDEQARKAPDLGAFCRSESEGRRVFCLAEPMGRVVVVEVGWHGSCVRLAEPLPAALLLLDRRQVYEGQGGGRRPPKGVSPFVFLLGAAYAAHLRRLLALFVFALSAPYGGPFSAYRLALRRWLLSPTAVALEG